MSAGHALRLAPDVTAAAAGDHQAFARLVDATRGTVSAITLAILRDVEASRDVAQEVYLLVWRDLRRLREPTSFLPWLRQMTRNRAHQALRTHVRRRRRFENGADALLAVAADPRPDPADRLLATEERVALERAISELPPSAREVVVLYYREGRSAAHVASLLDLSEEAVRQRLARARKRLRDSLVHLIEETAPGAGFTAGVLAAVASLAAPATASATVVGLAKAGKAGSVAPGLMGAGLFGALAGLAGGMAGVFYGTRNLLRQARDEEERRGVMAVGALCTFATLFFVVTITFWPTASVATAGFLVMMTCFFVGHFVWLPRITRRRFAAELDEDPVAAAAAHGRQRFQARMGFAIGTVLGGGTIVAAWFL